MIEGLGVIDKVLEPYFGGVDSWISVLMRISQRPEDLLEQVLDPLEPNDDLADALVDAVLL